MKRSDFPEGFIFGTATAAYQIEGAAAVDGKGPSIWDDFCQSPGKIAGGESGELACDHYNRFEQDLDLMKDLGLKHYRFSDAKVQTGEMRRLQSQMFVVCP